MENQVDFEALYLPNSNNLLRNIKVEQKDQDDAVKCLVKHKINIDVSGLCIEIKPFQCSFCEFGFGFNTDLETELMKHFRENHMDRIIKNESQIDIGINTIDNTVDTLLKPNEQSNSNVKELSNKNKHVCNVCDASYKFLHLLETHMIKQHKERRFKCSECSLRFLKKGALNEHKAIHRPPEFECDEDGCNMKFNWFKLLAKHKREIHDIKMNGKQNYMTMKYKKKAQQIVKNNSTFECKQEMPEKNEDLNVAEFVSVSLEQKLTNNEQGFLCPDCFSTFINQEQLEKHKSQSLNCLECDKTFCEKKERFMHRFDFHGISEDEKFIMCCGIFFLRASIVYNEHLKLLHEPKNNPSAHICDVCNKSFSSEHHLKEHSYIHSMPKLKCDFCDKTYSLHRNLKHHIKTCHAQIYSALTECEICGSDLKTEKELEKHMKVIHGNRTIQEFICDHCDRTFQTKTGLITHLFAMHTLNKPYKCDICLNSFGHQKYLKNHMIRTHGAGLGENKENNFQLFQCSICNERFANDEFLKAHQEKQASFNCDECSLSFCNPKTFFVHNNEVHNIQKDENYTKCELCSRVITNSSLSTHNSKYHRFKKKEKNTTKRFECNQCGKEYASRNYLVNHVKKHGEPKYECPSCGKMFFIERYLVDHIRIHHKEISFPCQICGKIFQTQRRLDDHVQRHADDNLSTVCSYCNKNFQTRSIVKEHIARVHLKLKNWKCHLCDRAFPAKRILKSHIQEDHLMENIFNCEICGKIIKKKCVLIVHMKRHMNIKEFECEVCQKRFPTNSSLNNHKKIHSDERSYVCNECGKSFKQYISLFLHNRRHKGIKPHKCTMCDKSFYQPNMLKVHMTYHTGERNYHCLPCKKSYISPACLKKHNKRHHNIINANSPQPEDVDKNTENGQQS